MQQPVTRPRRVSTQPMRATAALPCLVLPCSCAGGRTLPACSMLQRQCGSRSRRACSGSCKVWGPRGAALPQHLCLVVQASWGVVAAAATLLGRQAGQQPGRAQGSCSSEQGSCTGQDAGQVYVGLLEVTAAIPLEPENGLPVEAVTSSGTASCFLDVNDLGALLGEVNSNQCTCGELPAQQTHVGVLPDGSLYLAECIRGFCMWWCVRVLVVVARHNFECVSAQRNRPNMHRV